MSPSMVVSFFSSRCPEQADKKYIKKSINSNLSKPLQPVFRLFVLLLTFFFFAPFNFLLLFSFGCSDGPSARLASSSKKF